MKTTIDSAGRIVVPKRLRDAIGLAPGSAIEIEERDGDLVLRPVGPVTRIVRRRGRQVIEVDRPVPPLTIEQVRELIDSGRR